MMPSPHNFLRSEIKTTLLLRTIGGGGIHQKQVYLKSHQINTQRSTLWFQITHTVIHTRAECPVQIQVHRNVSPPWDCVSFRVLIPISHIL